MKTLHPASPTARFLGPIPPGNQRSLLASFTTVICFTLSLILLLLGCGLIMIGLLSIPGAFFVDSIMAASGLFVILGSISIVVAAAILAVPLIIIGRRQRW